MMTSDGTEPCPTCHGGIPRGTIALHARINELEEQLASANQRIDRLTNDCGKQKLRIRELESLVEMWKLCARGLGPAPSDSVSKEQNEEPDLVSAVPSETSCGNGCDLAEPQQLCGPPHRENVPEDSGGVSPDPTRPAPLGANVMNRSSRPQAGEHRSSETHPCLDCGRPTSYFAQKMRGGHWLCRDGEGCNVPRASEAIACGKGHHLSPTLRCTLATEHDGVCMYSIEAVLAACAPPAPRADKAKVEESKPNPEVYSRPECIWNYCCDPEGCIARNACQNPSRSAPRAETASPEEKK